MASEQNLNLLDSPSNAGGLILTNDTHCPCRRGYSEQASLPSYLKPGKDADWLEAS